MSITAGTQIWQVAQTVQPERSRVICRTSFCSPLFSLPTYPPRTHVPPRLLLYHIQKEWLRSRCLRWPDKGKYNLHNASSYTRLGFPIAQCSSRFAIRRVPTSSFGHKSLLILTTSKCTLLRKRYCGVGRIRGVCVCACVRVRVQNNPQARIAYPSFY